LLKGRDSLIKEPSHAVARDDQNPEAARARPASNLELEEITERASHIPELNLDEYAALGKVPK
jgi:hypothetical protein